jgi:hypothetical protein
MQPNLKTKIKEQMKKARSSQAKESELDTYLAVTDRA